MARLSEDSRWPITKPTFEVADLFAGMVRQVGSGGGGEVYPGYPGLVIGGGEHQRMAWGFPLVLKDKSGQPLKPKPVNNTRADNLDSLMSRYSFQERRCLIPVAEFAEAEGDLGAKMRTWFSLPNQKVFACAGIWRDTPEWGQAYSMVMTEACLHVADVHDRMPVILRREDWSDWLGGAPDRAALLCRPYPDLVSR